MLRQKDTEARNKGYTKEHAKGTYLCKGCDAPLYSSDTKFDSGCGWPAFWDGLPGAIKQLPDADGRRVEIVCARCDSHLGHVFTGEQFNNPKDERHVSGMSRRQEALPFEPLVQCAHFHICVCSRLRSASTAFASSSRRHSKREADDRHSRRSSSHLSIDRAQDLAALCASFATHACLICNRLSASPLARFILCDHDHAIFSTSSCR